MSPHRATANVLPPHQQVAADFAVMRRLKVCSDSFFKCTSSLILDPLCQETPSFGLAGWYASSEYELLLLRLRLQLSNCFWSATLVCYLSRQRFVKYLTVDQREVCLRCVQYRLFADSHSALRLTLTPPLRMAKTTGSPALPAEVFRGWFPGSRTR